MSPEVFQKYIDGLCDSQEKREVEQWLHTSTKKELDELLLPIWNNTSKSLMPAEQTDELWEKLSLAANIVKLKNRVIHSFFNRKLAVAAMVIGVITISSLLLFQRKPTAHAVVTEAIKRPSADSSKNKREYAVNAGNSQKTVFLEDGTEVLLFPHSVIKYPARFDNTRPVYLEGKGIFTVAKDAHRPFTVYSGNIATTALGTKFLVNEDNNSIHVRLYEGKIVVQENIELKIEGNKKILLPGDELVYNSSKKTIAVTKFSNKDAIVHDKKNAEMGKEELNFTNIELIEVFEKFKHKYRVSIEYNRADIAGMYFTGTISSKSSLSKLLQVIARMNGLIIQDESGKYIVQKAAE